MQLLENPGLEFQLYTYLEKDVLSFLTFGFFILRIIRTMRLLGVVLRLSGKKQVFGKWWW